MNGAIDQKAMESTDLIGASGPTTNGNPWRLGRMPALALIGLARMYQVALSPMFGSACRFTPTCSEYFIQAVRRDGAVRGALRGLRRLGRCHPFHPGGWDPP